MNCNTRGLVNLHSYYDFIFLLEDLIFYYDFHCWQSVKGEDSDTEWYDFPQRADFFFNLRNCFKKVKIAYNAKIASIQIMILTYLI